jgi:hypothetical protein
VFHLLLAVEIILRALFARDIRRHWANGYHPPTSGGDASMRIKSLRN